MRSTLIFGWGFELCENAVFSFEVLVFDFLVVGRFGHGSGSAGASES
jgi:hypothetical protein